VSTPQQEELVAAEPAAVSTALHACVLTGKPSPSRRAGRPLRGEVHCLRSAERGSGPREHAKVNVERDRLKSAQTDEPMFGTVKESFIGGRHLTFVSLVGARFASGYLQVAVSKEQVKSAPNIELQGDEFRRPTCRALYHHYELTTPARYGGRSSPCPPLS
jgi:hypothetical protein